MTNKQLEEHIGYIRNDLERLNKKLEPSFKIEEAVQHSIIWGLVVIVAVYLISWTIRTLN